MEFPPEVYGKHYGYLSFALLRSGLSDRGLIIRKGLVCSEKVISIDYEAIKREMSQTILNIHVSENSK
ncbi:MAG TPA: hypothetical protein ENG83_12705 [Nitrospirae bacterium]|nr:hypothetical protein [Nitrospirota bacterium]HDZ00589.1 hypothetical protein [Nitrospirota bacterium]